MQFVKNLFLLLIVWPSALFFIIPLHAQVTIGESTHPHSFSMLEIVSKTQKEGGLRLPQLTTDQRIAITPELLATGDNTAKGLLIYNTTDNCLEFWSGERWMSLCINTEDKPAPPNPNPKVTTGSGILSGRTCFDIVYSNSGGICGTPEGRTWKADFTQPSFCSQTYTFTPTGSVSKLRFAVVESLPGKIIASMVYSPTYETATHISSTCTLTLVYQASLATDARGLTDANALKADIYAIYNDNGDGNGTIKATMLTAKIKDCNCCGAPTTSGTWINFMCHNLGADTSLDPFTYYSKGDTVTFDIKGSMYQWGRLPDGHEYRSSATIDTQANGYNPITPSDHIGKFIEGTSNWLNPQNDNLWGATKTPSDPCPTGWKVPSSDQWDAIYDANTWTWTNNGYQIGDALFLPAGGYRDYNKGELTNVGSGGSYWSTTISTVTPDKVFDLYFENATVYRDCDTDRAHGVMVRCIEDK